MTYVNTARRINPNFVQPTTIWTQPVSHTTQKLGKAFEPKKAGKNTSHVVFVLDDSASMQSCREATISGFNEFLENQKKDAEETGIKTFVSLYKFDGSNVNVVFERVSINEVEPLNERTYNPRGMTNLYDAIGGVMMKINLHLSERKKKKRDSIIVTILTDGHENASSTFNSADVKQMVEKAEGKNWGFMFLGANINAFDAGASLGFGAQNTMQYTTNNMGDTMRAASAMTSRLKSSYADGMNSTLAYASSTFTDQERSSAVGNSDE